MRWSRWLIGLIVIVGMLFLCKTVHTIYLGYLAERDYILSRLILELIEGCIAKHGEWPQSWHDFEQVKPEWDWPLVQERITVDFDIDIYELTGQSANQFQAIRPIHPNALFNDDILRRQCVEPLLETIRKLTKKNCEAVDQEGRQRGHSGMPHT